MSEGVDDNAPGAPLQHRQQLPGQCKFAVFEVQGSAELPPERARYGQQLCFVVDAHEQRRWNTSCEPSRESESYWRRKSPPGLWRFFAADSPCADAADVQVALGRSPIAESGLDAPPRPTGEIGEVHLPLLLRCQRLNQFLGGDD